MGLTNSFVPSAKPMKFSTVLGASFSNSLQTIFPSVVSKIAYVPAGRAMVAPYLRSFILHRFRRHSQIRRGSALLPAPVLSQLGNVCGVVLAMPRVQKQHPVQSAHAVLGMTKRQSELVRLRRMQEAYPAFMQRFEQTQRNLHRRMRGVFEFSPGTLCVRLDGRLVFRQGQAPADIRVHVAVGNMVHDLSHRPSAFAIGRV